MKYEFTDETKTIGTITLTRIRSLIELPGVKVGDLGGWLSKAENLSQSGTAWVSDNARVSGTAWVSDNARVSGTARVSDNARVSGTARVSDNAWVSGTARVSGNAWVYGNAVVSGTARVYGNAWVYGDAWVYGNARVSGTARVSEPELSASEKAWRAYCAPEAHDSPQLAEAHSAYIAGYETDRG